MFYCGDAKGHAGISDLLNIFFFFYFPLFTFLHPFCNGFEHGFFLYEAPAVCVGDVNARCMKHICRRLVQSFFFGGLQIFRSQLLLGQVAYLERSQLVKEVFTRAFGKKFRLEKKIAGLLKSCYPYCKKNSSLCLCCLDACLGKSNKVAEFSVASLTSAILHLQFFTDIYIHHLYTYYVTISDSYSGMSLKKVFYQAIMTNPKPILAQMRAWKFFARLKNKKKFFIKSRHEY